MITSYEKPQSIDLFPTDSPWQLGRGYLVPPILPSLLTLSAHAYAFLGPQKSSFIFRPAGAVSVLPIHPAESFVSLPVKISKAYTTSGSEEEQSRTHPFACGRPYPRLRTEHTAVILLFARTPIPSPTHNSAIGSVTNFIGRCPPRTRQYNGKESGSHQLVRRHRGVIQNYPRMISRPVYYLPLESFLPLSLSVCLSFGPSAQLFLFVHVEKFDMDRIACKCSASRGHRFYCCYDDCFTLPFFFLTINRRAIYKFKSTTRRSLDQTILFQLDALWLSPQFSILVDVESNL